MRKLSGWKIYKGGDLYDGENKIIFLNLLVIIEKVA